MKSENWKLPDGSEIAIEHSENTSITSFDGQMMVETADPLILKAVEEVALPGETFAETLNRLLKAGLKSLPQTVSDSRKAGETDQEAASRLAEASGEALRRTLANDDNEGDSFGPWEAGNPDAWKSQNKRED